MPDEKQTQQQVSPVTPPVEEKGAGETPVDFGAFLQGQPEPVKKAYDTHVAGLKSALTAEREQGKALQGRLADIKKLFGSDPEKAKLEMDKLAEENKSAQSRIEFLEEAAKPEIECLYPSAAWLVATGKGLFKQNGTPDWKAIREEAPPLFGKGTLKAHGGNGMGDTAPKKFNINTALREDIQDAQNR